MIPAQETSTSHCDDDSHGGTAYPNGTDFYRSQKNYGYAQKDITVIYNVYDRHAADCF